MSIYPASINDDDPAVLYGGYWEYITQDRSWRGTMHSTRDIGSFARVRFTGSRVAIICIIPTGSGARSMATIKVDNGEVQHVEHVTTPPVQFEKIFWDSGPLTMGSHVVEITNAGTEAYFRMDRIDYDPSESNAIQAPQATPTPLPPATRTESETVTVTQTQATQISQLGPDTSITSEFTSQTSIVAAAVSTGSFDSPSIETVVSVSTASVLTHSVFPPADSGISTAGSVSEKGGIPLALVFGIVGGAVALLLLLFSIVFVHKYRRRRGRLDSKAKAEDGDDFNLADSMTLPRPFPISNQRLDTDSGYSQRSFYSAEKSKLSAYSGAPAAAHGRPGTADSVGSSTNSLTYATLLPKEDDAAASNPPAPGQQGQRELPPAYS